MTVCAPHTLTKPLPTCLATLVVGTIDELSANIRAYLYNLTTRRTTTIQSTTDGAGLITLDLSELDFSPNHSYLLTVTLAGDDVNSLKLITVGTTVTDQLALRFEDIYASDGDMEMYTVQTLEVVE